MELYCSEGGIPSPSFCISGLKRILFPSNDLFDWAYTSDNLSDLKESHYELWMRNKK